MYEYTFTSMHRNHRQIFTAKFLLSDFYVHDESDYYRLHISGYSGTAGDSMNGYPLDKKQFSTRDRGPRR